MKYLIYREDDNCFEDVMFDSIQQIFNEFRKPVIEYLLRVKFYNQELKEVVNETDIPRLASRYENPCTICDRRLLCIVGAECPHTPVVYEVPDEINFAVSPKFFFGLSDVLEVIERLPEVRRCKLTFAGEGEVIE